MNEVTVIIPAYNSEKYIKSTLDSLSKQEFQDFDLIIVNDGSSDHTQEICQEFAKDRSNVILINSENKGVSAARNIGLKNTHTPYVTFLDADDTIEPDHLKTLYINMKEYNADLSMTSVFYTAGENYYGKVQKTSDTETAAVMLNRDEAAVRALKSDGFKGYVINKLFQLKTINDNNVFFDETLKMMEDLHFTIRYIRYCTRIVFENKKTYNYIQRTGSAMHDGDVRYQSQRYMNLLSSADKINQFISENYDSNSVKEAGIARTVDNYSAVLRVLVAGKDKKIISFLQRYIFSNYFTYFKSDLFTIKRKIGVLLFTVFPGLGYLRHRSMIGS